MLAYFLIVAAVASVAFVGYVAYLSLTSDNGGDWD